MKKIYQFIIIITIIVSFVSCLKMKEVILDSPMADTYIESENDALSLLKGAYSFLSNPDMYKDNYFNLLFFSGDDVMTATAAYRPVLERTVAISSVDVGDPWGEFYELINNTNSLLAAFSNSDVISEEFKKKALGELYFLRGYSYFNLVRLYGGVPLSLAPTTGTSDFYLERSTVEKVYTQVFDDLKKANEWCIPFNLQPANELGRATKGAAQAMLALAYLTYGNYNDLKQTDGKEYYQLAKNYADSVILSNQYSLLPNYADLWDVNKEKNAYKEVIFGVQFARDGTSSGNPSKGSSFAFRTQPTQRYFVTGSTTSGKGSDQWRLQPWFYDLCTTGDFTGDYRTDVTFLTQYSHQGGTTTRITYPRTKMAGNELVDLYPYLNKYRDPDGLQDLNNENDLFIIRLSEVYLIKAEAENELNGPTAVAYEAFNKLRERARLANGTARTTPANLTSGLSKENFRLKVFDERGLELVGEGHRWFDLVRMRYIDGRTMMQYRYETFLPSLPKTAPAYNATTNTWGGGKVYPTNIVAWSKKMLLWPIPGREIDTNPNMKQNSEYGW